MRRVAALALTLAAALAEAPAGAAELEAEGRALPFISNDYTKALGEARARSLPLFIEAWAPW
jgi:hypothetical protein